MENITKVLHLLPDFKKKTKHDSPIGGNYHRLAGILKVLKTVLILEHFVKRAS
jgi:hypothetical protein